MSPGAPLLGAMHSGARPAMLAGWALLILVLGLGVGAASAAEPAASDPPEIPAELAPAQVSEILSGLTDQQVRAVLLDQLQRRAAAQAPPPAPQDSPVEILGRRLATASAALAAMLRAAPEVVSGLPNAWDQITDSGARSALSLLLLITLAFALGYAAESGCRRAIRTLVEPQQIVANVQRSWLRKLLSAIVRAFLDLVGVVLFGVIAGLALEIVTSGTDPSQQFLLAILNFTLTLRVVSLLLRLLLAPEEPWSRLVPVDDVIARTLHRRFLAAMGLLFLGRETRVVLSHYGLAAAPTDLIVVALSLSFALALMLFAVQMRKPLRQLILAGIEHPSASRLLLAERAYLLVAAGVLAVWALAVLVNLATGKRTLLPGMVTLATLFLLPAGDLALRALTRRWLGPEEGAPGMSPGGPEPAAPAPEQHRRPAPPAAPATAEAADSYQAVALRNLRMLGALLLAGALMEIWGLDLGALLGHAVGGRVAAAVMHVGVAALLAYSAWSIIETALKHFLGPMRHPGAAAGVDPEGGTTGGSRLATILPLLRRFIFITLIAMIVMIGLSSLGVNIGPLLAGAGVIGIAVGFGAQTLIQDIISGLFFLLDDAFRVGEYVEMGDIRGTVEGMSIRSLRLRHHNGPIHTVPFGQIGSLTNYSRDWAMIKFELRIPFETDVDKVRKIIKKIGEQMLQDPEIGPLVLEPLKSQGVNRMDDSALIIRCKVMTVPGQQFYVRRVAYTMIQRAFEKARIHFAPKRVIVESATPDLAAAAASAGALDELPQKAPDDRG